MAHNPNLVRNRLMVVLIAMISIIPFGFAWFLSKNPDLVQAQSKSNYGQLIAPARPLDYAALLQNPLNPADPLPEIQGHWILLQISNSPVCAETCLATAVKTGKMRVMLNKELTRVRRLLLLHNQTDPAANQQLVQTDPTLIMAGLSEELKARLQEAIGGPLSEGGLILLDPHGNAMMWYPPDFNPYGVLKDLRRLLKISQIG